MRKLGLKDAFALARIVKAANLREEIVAFASAKSGSDNVKEVGFEFVLAMITSIGEPKAERMIYELYADIKGDTAENVALYDIKTLKKDFDILVEENDLHHFFNLASSLISKQLNS